jgi:exopolysaccharide production protein ExoQ
MCGDVHSRMGAVVQARRSPWLVFLFLTAVFFFLGHDLFYTKTTEGNYGASAADLAVGVEEGSLPRRIDLFALAIFAVALLVRYRRNDHFHFHGLLGWLLLIFAAWAMVSLIWADDTALVFKRIVVFAILCLAAGALARRFAFREIMLWTLFSSTLFLMIGVSAEVLFGAFHPLASGYRFAGTVHPNSQGVNCGLLLLSGLATAEGEKRGRKFIWACALAGFVFLVLTGSRTAVAATLFALVAYLSGVCSRKAKIAMAYALGFGLCLLLTVLGEAALPTLKSAVLLGRDDSTIDSFNGRTGIWEEIGPYVDRRPILGYGYEGFWTPARISEISDEETWGLLDSHSAYLDYLLTLGAVGVVFYVLLLCVGIFRAFRLHQRSHNPAVAFCGAILVFCALDGLLESSVVHPTPLLFLGMVVLARLAFAGRPAAIGIVGR